MQDLKEKILIALDYTWRIICWIIACVFLFILAITKEWGFLLISLIFLIIPFCGRRRNNNQHNIVFLIKSKKMSIMRRLMRFVLMSTAIVLFFFSLYYFYKSQSIYGIWCLIIGYGCVKLFAYGRKMNNQQPIPQQLKQIRNQLHSYDQQLLNNEVSSIENDVCTCLNCGQTYQGFYCPTCGQDRREDKISWTHLISEVINFDNKFIRTLYALVRCPGEMLHQYISGRHACYSSPIKFVFFAAIILAITSFIAYSDKTFNTETTVFNGDMVLFPCVIAFFVDFIPIYCAFCWTKVGKKLSSVDFYSIVLYFIGMDFLTRSVLYILPNITCSEYLRLIIMICYQFYVLKDFFRLSFWRTLGHYVIRFVLYVLCAFITLTPIFLAEILTNDRQENPNIENTDLPQKSFGETYRRTKKTFTFITGGIVEKLCGDIDEWLQDQQEKEVIEHADEKDV